MLLSPSAVFEGGVMKKNYLFLTGMLVLLFVMGCSTFAGVVSPPSWIRGTWTAYEKSVVFKFLPDNILYTNRQGTTISFEKEYAGMQVTDQSSDTLYTITVIGPETTTIYSFTLTGDNINYSVKENDTTIDIGLLTKETT